MAESVGRTRLAWRALRLCALASLLGQPWAALAVGSQAPFTPPKLTVATGEPSAAPTSPAGVSSEPPGVSSGVGSGAGLSGLRRGQPSQALIDGKWHRIGDAVGEARLLAIDNHRVTLAHADGRRQFLSLSPDARLTPVAAPTPAASAASDTRKKGTRK